MPVAPEPDEPDFLSEPQAAAIKDKLYEFELDFQSRRETGEMPSDETPGTIIQEMQAGYMIKDRLLRPAFGMCRVEWPGDHGVGAKRDGGEDGIRTHDTALDRITV